MNRLNHHRRVNLAQRDTADTPHTRPPDTMPYESVAGLTAEWNPS